jgi:hypothetical protein
MGTPINNMQKYQLYCETVGFAENSQLLETVESLHCWRDMVAPVSMLGKSQ